MGAKRFLFVFGTLGGLVSGALTASLLRVTSGEPRSAAAWLSVLALSVATFTLGGWLTWFRWARRGAIARRAVIGRLAGGDLAAEAAGSEAPEDLRRLILSLRRALFQVQRVTGNVDRTGRDLEEQARTLLQGARRQGAAVDRSLSSVERMGESLQVAGRRVAQLESFAQATMGSLHEMTERIEQVASALTTLDDFVHGTSTQVQVMSDGLSGIAASNELLARFAGEAAAFVSAVEGGIEAVRRRAGETGELAREVTATADRGEALVNDSVRGMYRVEETVRKAAEIVDALGVRSQEIRRIVDVIQDVADQTNLLSLNAAIIAAQAGEHGRAFGVVAEEIRGLAERTARSTREIVAMVSGIRGEVDAAVTFVKEGRAQASAGVLLGDRAASALVEIRAITRRTFSAVEATVAETARLETQGQSVVEASQRVATRVLTVTRAAVEQAEAGQNLVRQTQQMARLAQSTSTKAGGQARTGRELSSAVLKLTAAIDEIRDAHQVLTRGDAAIAEEVARVREDARTVIRIGDGLSRTVEQLSREARALEEEVFRFKLPEPRRGGTLRVGIHQSEMFEATRGLDPLFTLDNQMVEIAAALYSGLLRQEDGVVVAELAERWEAASDARRYRFFLRESARFHDGSPVRAEDVKRHFERLLDPAVNSPDQWIFREVEGARAYLAGEASAVSGFEVLDARTLEIRLEEPRAFFLHLVTLPATLVARAEPGGRIVGTGPFQPVRIAAEGVVLERFAEDTRPHRPWLDRLEFRFTRERGEAIGLLHSGEVDVVSGLYAEHVRSSGLEAQQIIAGSQPSCWFLAFQVQSPPFDDPRVRRGLRAGLDIRGVVERFHPGASVASTLTPPGLLAGERPPPPPADLALARGLLREAGKGPIRLTLGYPPGRSTQTEDALLFAPLTEAGLVELRHEELSAMDFWLRAREGRLPAFRAGWIADYPDPDNFLYFLLHSGAQTVYRLGYANPELDRLTAEARVSVDPERRQTLYRDAERIASEDCPLIPLYHERIYAAAGARVQGLRLHQTPPQIRFEQLWVDG